MAFVKCPECSCEISDEAAKCPKCGHVLLHTESELDQLLTQSLCSEGPIAAIKLYRAHKPEAGLLEAKQYIEKLRAKLPPEAILRSRQGCMSMLAMGALLMVGCLLFVLWRTLDKDP